MPALISENEPAGNVKLEPIAICGMSCHLPGNTTSPSKFWDLLTSKRAANTTKVPKSRFNIDAHFHKNLERPGCFNAPGGYFIDGPAENFDPTFFGMTPVEAMWLDPQQRKTLEACYEAFESAGLTLDSVSGSNTGVWVGSFTADYQQMTFHDHDFRHNYAATGVDVGIISNRIGNVFDLHGPSSTINTACSSSIYCLHQACNSLRARDCDAALVAGVNLILTVDQHMNTAKLGIMSPTSFCHTFDERADGYGRAEGAGALYLKRLDDAVRDGDVIRAVIRSSAVNSNGKVPGYGITYPNVDGQEMVIRKAYKRAGLDPDDTAYFECHGTGTPVGDPIEVRAVSRAMSDTRSIYKPLTIGAVKPNIGHSEAASGIFAVIKAALMVEKGFMPGVAGLEKLNPNIHEIEWNVRVNRDTVSWPEGFDCRRASLSSFGYGGTNGHVILENVENLVPSYRHGAAKRVGPFEKVASYDNSSDRPLLVTMSAHDKTTLNRNIEANGAVVNDYYLADFAHTLNTKRTAFAQRAFALVSEPTADLDFAPQNFHFGTPSPTNKGESLVFIFTGQGAAWPAMGRTAIQMFPVFREAISNLDRVLRTIPDPPSFYIEDQLCAPAESSKVVGDANVAQPTLVAIEIAMVDLLASWGITPTATIGHSAGEFAAAYAAGLVSAPEAIIAAYYRGWALERFAPTGGSMLALGKGVAELKDYEARLASLGLVVACENSPSSVTLSGMSDSVQTAKGMFDADGIFARELRTGMPYHSHHMKAVVQPMVEHVETALKGLDSIDKGWRNDRCLMVSTVYNRPLLDGDITPDYWAANLTGRVLFSTGAMMLAKEVGYDNIGAIIEVGPHSALAGPFKQICRADSAMNSLSSQYLATIVRTRGNSALSLLETAGQLYLKGVNVNLTEVNKIELRRGLRIKPRTLVDLPKYQWNYDKLFWAEPRRSAEYRQLTHARHDLLGRKILGLSDHSVAWRNVLRMRDLPWLADHKLGGSILFPAAGHLAIAIEAARQRCELEGRPIAGMSLQNVELRTALVIPDAETDVEIQLHLNNITSTDDKDLPSWSWSVESYNEGTKSWMVHSVGQICPIPVGTKAPQLTSIDTPGLTQRHSGKQWNDAFRRVGYEYGPTFATLDKVRTHGKYLPQAAGMVPIRTDSGVVEDESRHIIHPVTFDSVLQLAIVATHCGRIDTMPWGIIPVGFEEVNYYLPEAEAVGTEGQAIAWLPVRGKRDRHFITHAQLATQEGQLLVDIKGIQTISYEAALPPRNDFDLEPMPYSGVAWRADISMNAIRDIFAGTTKTSKSSMWELVHLFNHRDPIQSILAIDTLNSLDADREVNDISGAPQLTIVPGPVGNPLSPSMQGMSGQVVFDLSNFKPGTHDIVLAAGDDAKHIITDRGLMESLKTMLDEKARCVMMFDHQHILSAVEQMKSIGLHTTSIVLNDGALIVADNHVQEKTPEKVMADPITLAYSPQHSALPQALLDALAAQGLAVSIKPLDQVRSEQDKRVLLYNPFGNLLTHAAIESLDILKQLLPSGVPITWLTSGVNEGKSGGGSLVAGFLRVLREEQASCQVSLLDYDKNETHRSVAAAIFGIVTTPQPAENEYWLHNGILHTPRVTVNTNLNSRLTARDDEYVRVSLPRQYLQGDLVNGDLVFTPSDELQRVPIGSAEVELQVDNIELQADDLRTLPLDTPRLVSCTVTATGTEFRYLRAKTVLTWTTKPFETVIRVPGASCVECSSREAGALVSGLPNICRTINALGTSSLAGKSVLVANATPSMARAFCLVSERLGFKLKTILEVEIEDDEQSVSNDGSSSEGSFEVADSDVKRFMQDAGSSLVIFTQTFSHATRALWRHIPSGARFVLGECSTGDLRISPDARPFNRGATFQVATIKATMLSDAQALKSVVLSAMEVVNRNDMYASSISVYTPDTIKDAAGKTFEDGARLAYTYGQDMITKRHVPEQLQLSPEDVYLLVGCLGGLGRSLVSWMMDHGAKHFAFISRSGADKPEAARLIDQITAAGAVPQVFRGDAANTVDVIRAVEDVIASGRRIRGVVHAAMVLNDSMLPNMTLAKWNATLGPKMDGALVLHNVLKDQPLDFFVMTSSLSAQAGLPGQSNYAAANSFLDNLAMQRRSAGLAASSLVLPMVLGVGVVAESDDLEGQISKRGLYGVNEAEMLRGFEAAMLSSKPSASETDPSTAAFNAAIIMGLDPSRIGASIASTSNDTQLAWFDDKRFSSIKSLANIATGQAGGAGQGGAAESSISEQMNAAFTKEGFNAAMLLTASHIIKKCATILKQDEGAFDIDAQSIGAYGLDSMIGVELRNWLFKKLGLNIAFQELLAKTTTFRRLSEMVLLSHGIVAGN